MTLATLSFFCRRPTILAIMEFVNSIIAEVDSCESFSDTSSAAIENFSGEGVVDDQHLMAIEEPVVKGLLGKGKSRVMFNLTLNMARAQIVLMNEDGTKLATLSQDNLLTDIKVRLGLYILLALSSYLHLSCSFSFPKYKVFFINVINFPLSLGVSVIFQYKGCPGKFENK